MHAAAQKGSNVTSLHTRHRRRHDTSANPVRLAVIAGTPTRPEELRTQRTRELLAIEAFDTGGASFEDFAALDWMMSVARELGRSGIGAEVLPLVDDFAPALISAWRESGPMEMSEEGIFHAHELLAAHDEQRDMATRAELDRAVTTVALIRERAASRATARLHIGGIDD